MDNSTEFINWKPTTTSPSLTLGGTPSIPTIRQSLRDKGLRSCDRIMIAYHANRQTSYHNVAVMDPTDGVSISITAWLGIFLRVPRPALFEPL